MHIQILGPRPPLNLKKGFFLSGGGYTPRVPNPFHDKHNRKPNRRKLTRKGCRFLAVLGRCPCLGKCLSRGLNTPTFIHASDLLLYVCPKLVFLAFATANPGYEQYPTMHKIISICVIILFCLVVSIYLLFC